MQMCNRVNILIGHYALLFIFYARSLAPIFTKNPPGGSETLTARMMTSQGAPLYGSTNRSGDLAIVPGKCLEI
jgi:hypothetical protein